MAQITLTNGETQGSPAFPLGTSNTFADATGSTNETIYVASGTQAFGATFNDGGDTIVLAGAASQFQVSRSGSTIILTNGAGLTVTFPVPDSGVSAASAPRFVFNSGTSGDTSDDATFTLTNTGTAINFTNAAAGSTAQPVTTTATTVGGTTTAPVTVPISVTSTSVVEGSGNIVYTLTLAAAQTSPVSVTVAVASGATNGATDGSDFNAIANQTVTFAPGETTKTVTVTVLDDTTLEGTETVTLTLTGATLSGTSSVTAQILDNDGGTTPNNGGSFQLSTGSDTINGTALNDRFTGVQDITLPGKLLSQNDVVTGGDGNDLIELFNTRDANFNTVANVIEDGDFTNVTGVERLESNYNQITLGTEALQAGLVSVNTTSSDNRTTSGAGPTTPITGNSLQLGTALILDAAFVQALTATMSNRSGDTVALNLTSAAGSSIDTGSSGTQTDVNGNLTVFNPIDRVNFTGTITNPLRVTFTSTAVGNGTARDTAGALALTVQSEDGSDALTGGIVRFDDEGIRFTGAQFDVRDISGTQRGTFGEVVLGTSTDDTIDSATGGAIYANAGGGDDFVTGTGGSDFLVGGAGDDNLDGAGGIDSLLGGAGDDTLTGGTGIDALLDGGQGSDLYVYGIGEFVPAEVISDTGTDAEDVDFIVVHSHADIVDADFAGRSGIEGLATDTHSGFNNVTVGVNAQAAGIRNFVTSDDDLNASAYTAAVNVLGYGNIQTGTGNDTVSFQGSISSQLSAAYTGAASANDGSFGGSVNLGTGDDTLNAGFALANGANDVLAGGGGSDTLALGPVPGSDVDDDGNLSLGDAVTVVDPFGANFTGFETVVINATGEGTAASYDLTIVDANVATGTAIAVDGSALRADAVLPGGDGVLGTGDDTTVDETLTVDASALTATRGLSATGGAGGDSLTGGAGVDTLIGNAGDDQLFGNAGADVLRGGAGDDQLTGGAGLDDQNGGEGSDTYRYVNGEFVAGDVVADDGATGTDTIDIVSATQIVDTQFAGKVGVEILTTDVTGTAQDTTDEVVIGANARTAGIVTVNNGDDDLNASVFGAALTVNTVTGNVRTGSGNDVVNIAPDAASLGTFRNAGAVISLGDGDDTLNAGYEVYNAGNPFAATLSGGLGFDTITIGGTSAAPFGGGILTFNFDDDANFTGFERLVIQSPDRGSATVAGTAVGFEVSLADANVAAAAGSAIAFEVDATALGASITAPPAGTTFSTLDFDGSALTGSRNVKVTGGEGDDSILGGAGADQLFGGLGDDIITGGLGNDTIEGNDGDDTLTGGDGFDTIRGGAGDDLIILDVTQFNSDADQVDGGADTDILQINGTAPVQDIADVGFNGRFTSIEEVRLVGQGGGTAFNYQAGFYSETAGVRLISLGANASGSTVSVANYAVAGATLNDTVVTTNDSILVGSNFADTFNLGANNDATVGGGSDIVRAGGGNDVINFGETFVDGSDIVDGGTGSDTLNVSAASLGTLNVTFEATRAGGVTTAGIFSVDTLVVAPGLDAVDNTAAGADVAGTASNYAVVFSDDTSFDGTTSTITIDGSALRAQVIIDVGADGDIGTGDDGVPLDEQLNVDGSLVAGTGHSIVALGGAAADTLTGGAGADTLTGNDGNDLIAGNGGVDTIDGGAGDDTLNGGAGNDIITGGTGEDTITGGAGADTVNLGADGARDTVIIAPGDAPRADIVGIEQINGFTTGSRGVGADTVLGNGDDTYTASADLIDFGFGLIVENSTSITNGVVQQGSVLQSAINSSTSLLAAIQLVEQEFNADPNGGVANTGVIAFTYGTNTYIGLVQDTDTGAGITEAFTSIVQINGLTNVTGLIDDAAVAGTGIGLYV